MFLRRAFPLLLLCAAGCAARRVQGTGLILEVDRGAATVTISHDRIPGFMDAMAMPFQARDARLVERVRRGDRVRFRLSVSKRGTELDALEVVSAAPVDPSRWQSPVVSRLVGEGEPMPDFELVDHDGRPCTLGRYRGRVVALNFIYTRCPLEDYCPRTVRNFAALQERFAARLGRDLVLLSVTLDPEHDTPEVLGRYGRRSGATSEAWRFLTGPRATIVRAAGLFGIEFWAEEGAITHNLETAVIGRDGRLAARVEGKGYTAVQLGDLIERLLGE